MVAVLKKNKAQKQILFLTMFTESLSEGWAEEKGLVQSHLARFHV